jgi:hypothetical protein
MGSLAEETTLQVLMESPGIANILGMRTMLGLEDCVRDCRKTGF